ncbi:MAG TPA: histidinol dehydrogenase [Candidatus Limnocylindrales bacterium]|nr:histidinol dehydrogenase [Candidatus Limnocylindrales bacterium]
MPIVACSFKQYQETHAMPALNEYTVERGQVEKIIAAVRQNGDTALKEYTRQFDLVKLDSLRVAEEELAAAVKSIEPALLEAIRRAKDNIERFHRHQISPSWWDAGPGWLVGQRCIPLQNVGIYIPGGTAAYPSSVLMTVIPARLAGVKEIYICTPPDSSGSVNPVTLAAAFEAGATAVFKVGGAQAIAALAYGTETIPAVQKIVGPGNIYVTLAKREVFGKVGIDMLAGPSEIVIVADAGANPVFVAADLLSQAEHDPLSRSLLITPSEALARLVTEQLCEQLATLPRRETAERSLREHGAIILVSDLDEAWPVVNELSPEHLELHLDDAWSYLDRIENAGAVFVGPFTPESLGDYWAGSNHVLPTGTAARYASALGVAEFVKHSHVLCYTSAALQKAAPEVMALARAEGLEAHARAVKLRRQNDDPQSQG